ncbi:DUF3307 domain-containing protein [Pseudoruegeria sp. HB172150]|uniref:DUF3307 domain-containing protein n=1 Tax=Pseudoruegeria sp. HB172150 TaxID=2721164 RepID=UPI0015552424|nr:DUF3307 domain-containing protein [Pseudoruegeria sp. HB172150]
MIPTLAALLFAHVLADFLLQPGWMAAGKRNPLILLAHGAVVLVLSCLATGQPAPPALLVLAAAHVVIDGGKAWIPAARGIIGFLTDQGLHLVTLVAVSAWAPDLWGTGAWSMAPAFVLHGAVLVSGLILATQGGRFAVALLVKDLTTPDDLPSDGLPKGGMVIGLLERVMIFVLIIAGQPAAIGFLIAAKSILRFGTVQEDRAASEYVIIGTLASFAWAIAVTLLCETLRGALPPLEIAAPQP